MASSPTSGRRGHPLLAVLGLVVSLAVFGVGGCSVHRSASLDRGEWRARAQSTTRDGLRVTAAIPSDEESAAIFGVSLGRYGIQPVWLEIENQTAGDYWLARVGLDPEYFTALEAANRCRHLLAPARNARMRERFLALELDPYVGPHATVSGFVLTRHDRGVKAVNIDLVGRGDLEQFFFLMPIPNLEADFQRVDFRALYRADEIREVDEDGLRHALASLPCCATTADGSGIEDPLNFVLLGAPEEVFPGFVRSGWHVTEALTAGASLRTFWSYFFSSSYRHAPISAVYAFGRRQDLALQKSRETARERNHLRIWLLPLRFQGRAVWVGQISRDIGLTYGWKNLVGHEVDPDVDEARNYLLQDLMRAQVVRRIGWVGGVGPAPRTAPRFMDDGSPFFTDGLRVVLECAEGSTPMEEIRRFDWESPRPPR